MKWAKEGGWVGGGWHKVGGVWEGGEGQNGKSQQVHQLRRGAASQVGGDLSYRPGASLSPNLPPQNYSGANHQTGEKGREDI